MSNEQRRAIRQARRSQPDRQFHYDTDAQMLVFADLHKARSCREKAVRS